MDDSLYFSEQHLATREMVRQFARDEVAPVAAKHDADATFPVGQHSQDGRARTARRAVARGARRRRTRSDQLHDRDPRARPRSTHRTVSRSRRTPRSGRRRSSASAPTSRSGGTCRCSRPAKSWAASASRSPTPGATPAERGRPRCDTGDCYVLNGVKRFITHGGVGEIFVVTAVTDPSQGHEGHQLVHPHQTDERS